MKRTVESQWFSSFHREATVAKRVWHKSVRRPPRFDQDATCMNFNAHAYRSEGYNYRRFVVGKASDGRTAATPRVDDNRE